ncbi:MAG TPA: hypothetical protein VLB44_00915, partial [Kofleriaceae bacterium]|nr:hypothetical protein [Kofleriaceae bacterium]
MHGKLVRQLLDERADHDADLVAAHVAHALALDTLKPTEVRGLDFDCFTPKPLEPRALVGLLRRHGPVSVIMPDEASTTEALVDDGSHAARVILSHLGKRARRVAPTPVAPTPAPPQPVKLSPPKSEAPRPVVPKPAPRPAPPPKPPAPPHPLEGLVVLLSQRVGELGIKGYEWTIDDERSPMFRFAVGGLVVAGDNERLRALASQLGSSSPWLATAIDALAAHVVSLLNIELTEITDATEISALGALLANQRSAGPPRSRRSS